MQHAAIVVLLIEVIHCINVELVEVVLLAFLNIFEGDANVLITIRRALLMIEAQGMQHFVHYGAHAIAALVQRIILKIHLLHTILEANSCKAAARLRGYIHVVFLLLGDFLEGQTGTCLDFSQADKYLLAM